MWFKLTLTNLPPIGREVLIFIPSDKHQFQGQVVAWRKDEETFISNMNLGLPIPVKLVSHWRALPSNP